MIVQALVLLLHFALFSFEGADRSSATHTWPVGQAAKTAASHAANVGSIPARVTTYFLLKKKVSKEDFSQSSLQSEKQLNRELTVEKNGEEKKVH